VYAPDGQEVGAGVLAGAEAARLLREHAGAGGAAVADHLDDDTMPVESWIVVLKAADVSFSGHSQGVQLLKGIVGYDRASRAVRTPAAFTTVRAA
jgi:hypothetical protein